MVVWTMARPIKRTVDYFPHDSDAGEGRTLTILFNTFGHEGISVWWTLLERISSTDNHVISINNPEDFLFLSAKLHVQPERLKDILDKLAYLNALDLDLYNHGLIWCQNLVDRVADVYKNRGNEPPPKPSYSNNDNSITNTDNPVTNTSNALNKIKLNKTKENIRELYHSLCPSLPKLIKLTTTRENKLLTRLKEMPNIEQWEQVFRKVEESDFLTGRSVRNNGHENWKCTFDWIIGNDTHIAKILEGQYDNSNKTKTQATQRVLRNVKDVIREIEGDK
jgi:hypothetical protein